MILILRLTLVAVHFVELPRVIVMITLAVILACNKLPVALKPVALAQNMILVILRPVLVAAIVVVA